MTVIATSCWARTSSGLRGMTVVSIAPSCIRRATTAASSRSPRYFGKMTPLLGAPTWCPARPTRCRPRATLVGLSTWMTRSTAPMSMPSSSELVATSAGSRPALSSSSIARRCSRAMLPWCARTSSSPASSFRRCASRSLERRLLVKTIVLRCARISSRIARVDRRPDARTGPRRRRRVRRAARRAAGPRRWPPCRRPGRRPGARAACARRHRRSSTSRPGPMPARNRAIASSGRCVADRPMRCGGVVLRRPQGLEALERQREVRAALRAGDRVDLVDDDVLDAAQRLAGRAREHQVQRSRGS